MSIGKRIKAARQLRGMTQAELAAKTQISERMIQRYEADERKPKDSSALKLANVLDINPLALKDEPISSSYYAFMFSLFDAEDEFGNIEIVDHNGKKAIIFNNSQEDISNWKTAKETLNDEEMIEWKLTYPNKVAYNRSKKKMK